MTTAAIDDELCSAIGHQSTTADAAPAAGRPGTATSLSRRPPLTRQAAAKHLAIQSHARPTHPITPGRERRYHIDQKQPAQAVAPLASVAQSWDRRLHRIKRIAETIQRERDTRQPDSPPRDLVAGAEHPDERTQKWWTFCTAWASSPLRRRRSMPR